jgi:hypothetical protein
MILYTRMGWLVPALWLAAIAASSQIPASLLVQYGFGLNRATLIFLLAAAVSTPLVFIAGKLLNRDKAPRRIVRFGKEKIVNWGSHTFYMLPVEYWAIMIPGATIVFYAIFTLV